MEFCSSFDKGDFGDFATKEDVDKRASVLAKVVYGEVFALSKEQSQA